MTSSTPQPTITLNKERSTLPPEEQQKILEKLKINHNTSSVSSEILGTITPSSSKIPIVSPTSGSDTYYRTTYKEDLEPTNLTLYIDPELGKTLEEKTDDRNIEELSMPKELKEQLQSFLWEAAYYALTDEDRTMYKLRRRRLIKKAHYTTIKMFDPKKFHFTFLGSLFSLAKWEYSALPGDVDHDAEYGQFGNYLAQLRTAYWAWEIKILSLPIPKQEKKATNNCILLKK